MDTNYTSQLFLSILFFAPGAILFAGLAFLGLLMLLEKTFFNRADNALVVNAHPAMDLAAGSNPAPGRIVASLKTAMQPPTTKAQRKANQ